MTTRRRTPAAKPATKPTTKAATKKPPAATTRKRRAPARESVLAAVNRDLAGIAKRDKELAGGALAATVRMLARELDDPKNSPTSKAACARALTDTVAQLRALAPKAGQQDGLDELRDRRASRLSRRAKA